MFLWLLMLDSTNGTVEYVCRRNKLEARCVKVSYPLDIEKVIADFDAAVDSETQVCVVDHISSVTAIQWPVKRFRDIARKK